MENKMQRCRLTGGSDLTRGEGGSGQEAAAQHATRELQESHPGKEEEEETWKRVGRGEGGVSKAECSCFLFLR